MPPTCARAAYSALAPAEAYRQAAVLSAQFPGYHRQAGRTDEVGLLIGEVLELYRSDEVLRRDEEGLRTSR